MDSAQYTAVAADPPTTQHEDSPSTTEEPKTQFTQRGTIHWHYFGRHGIHPTTKTTRYSWPDVVSFAKPVKLEWQVQLSEQALLRILYGYAPIEMSDKWFIYADGPNQAGEAIVNFHRSWTGEKIAELSIQIDVGKGDDVGLWKGKILGLTVEGDEEQAAKNVEAALQSRKTRANDESDEELQAPADALASSQTDGTGKDDESSEGLNNGNYDGDHVAGNEPDYSLDVARDDEEGESWVEFLVVTACNWVMGIDIGVEVEEPERWKLMSTRPAKEEPIRVNAYMGTSASPETIELLQRLGPGTQITFS